MRTAVSMTLSQENIKGKQRNHGDFQMPVSIRHLGEMPLYRAVAWWGFYLGMTFSRDDVSHAFHIEPRRASGILNYLCHRDNSNDIVLEAHQLPVSERGLLTVRILSVSETSPRPAPVPPVRRESKDKGELDRQLARWLLARPVATDAARLEAWKAACPVEEVSC